jgi:hypothetical protein
MLKPSLWLAASMAILISVLCFWPTPTARLPRQPQLLNVAESSVQPRVDPTAGAASRTAERQPVRAPRATPQLLVARVDTPVPASADAARAREAAADLERHEARTERLGQQWRDEAPDVQWTDAERESIADMVRSADLDPGAVTSVSCRTTLCRIALALPDLTAANKLAAQAGSDRANYQVIDADDDIIAGTALAAAESDTQQAAQHYVVYAVRPGQRIDSIDDGNHRP